MKFFGKERPSQMHVKEAADRAQLRGILTRGKRGEKFPGAFTEIEQNLYLRDLKKVVTSKEFGYDPTLFVKGLSEPYIIQELPTVTKIEKGVVTKPSVVVFPQAAPIGSLESLNKPLMPVAELVTGEKAFASGHTQMMTSVHVDKPPGFLSWIRPGRNTLSVLVDTVLSQEKKLPQQIKFVDFDYFNDHTFNRRDYQQIEKHILEMAGVIADTDGEILAVVKDSDRFFSLKEFQVLLEQQMHLTKDRKSGDMKIKKGILRTDGMPNIFLIRTKDKKVRAINCSWDPIGNSCVWESFLMRGDYSRGNLHFRLFLK